MFYFYDVNITHTEMNLLLKQHLRSIHPECYNLTTSHKVTELCPVSAASGPRGEQISLSGLIKFL